MDTIEKKKLNYNKQALVDFIRENVIQVPVLLSHLTHDVIIADIILEKLNEFCNISKQEFQIYINGLNNSKGEYERDLFIDGIINKIEYPMSIRTYGWEKIGNKPYVYLHKIIK